MNSKKSRKNSIIDVLNLKVPESKKTRDWYIEVMEHYVPNHDQTIEDHDAMKSVYEFMNNDLRSYKDEITQFCNPASEDLVSEVQETLYPFNRLYGKTQGMLGELLKRNDPMKVVLHSEEVFDEEDELYREQLRASLQEKIEREIELFKARNRNASAEEIEQITQEYSTQPEPEEITKAEWRSDWKIFYDHVLKYCKYDQEIKLKQQETFKDVLYVDRFFIYVGWKHGKPYIEVLNPLFAGYHKSPNTRFIQKGDYAWYKESITLSDAITEFKEKLSNEDIEDLKSYAQNYRTRVDKRHSLNGDYVVSRPATDLFEDAVGGSDYGDKRTGTYQAQGNVRHYSNEVLLWKVHFEFKAFKKIMFLTTTDEYNDTITTLVDARFKIPKEAEKIKFVNRFGDDNFKYRWEENGQDYEAEILWIPRRYEVTRLGDHVYVNAREVPNQPDNVENPYSDFELSYKGVVINSRNAKSLSPVQRAIPSQLQYYFIKHIQNRELAKYQGFIQDVDVDQIPEMLGQDFDGEKVKDHVATWMKIRKLLSVNFYSGSQNSLGGLPPSTRSPGSRGYMVGTAVELMNLQNLLELIDREMGFMFGYTPQREGSFTRGTNASDNRQALTQSHHTTEPLYYVHSLVWKSAFSDYLKLFRTYCEQTLELYPERKDLTFNYFFNNKEEIFRVTRKELSHTDLGIYLSNSGESQRYLDTMMQLSQAIAQNAGEGVEQISTLIKAITSGSSPEEVDRMISVAAEKQRRRQQEMEQMRLKSQERQTQMMVEQREDAQKHEIDKIQAKGAVDKDIAVTKETIKAMAWAEDKDQDNDGQLDVVEIYKAEKAKEEVDIKKKELDHKIQKDQKELDLKEKELRKKKE